MPITDQELCIRTTDFSETSQIVTLFTCDHGKVGAIAKGAKRAKSSFGGPIEVFSYGPVLYREARQGGLATLCEFEPRHDVVAGLSRNVYAYYCSLLVGELLNKLIQEHDAHPGLFTRVLSFLQEISATDSHGPNARISCSQLEVQAQLARLLIALLTEIGLGLQLEVCGNCHAPSENQQGEIYFSSAVSSFICRDCEASYPDRIPITRAVLASLRQPPSLIQADQTTVQAVIRCLIAHFTNLLHQRPKTAQYVIG